MCKFSVLMSIYKKEEPKYFDRAMQSIWDEQSIKPNEIILVQDGPLTDELNRSIVKWEEKLGELFKTIPLDQNIGLGGALNEGIKYCSYELIARMDTDDISLPNRFEKQLKVFKNSDIDVCSAWITEFDKDEDKIISYRKIPEKHKSIVKYSKFRSPINHIPVMFKKKSLEKVGGYKHMLWLEDYYLCGRLILSGAKFYNIQEPLANIRAGYDQLERRSGWAYAKSEIKLLKEFRKIKFLNKYEFIKNILLKVPIRLMPKSIIKNIYKLLRKA